MVIEVEIKQSVDRGDMVQIGSVSMVKITFMVSKFILSLLR